MRNRIFGAIGVLWGGAILVSGLMRGLDATDGAYRSGQAGGLLFGAVMLIVGLYFLIKGSSVGPGKARRSAE